MGVPNLAIVQSKAGSAALLLERAIDLDPAIERAGPLLVHALRRAHNASEVRARSGRAADREGALDLRATA